MQRPNWTPESSRISRPKSNSGLRTETPNLSKKRRTGMNQVHMNNNYTPPPSELPSLLQLEPAKAKTKINTKPKPKPEINLPQLVKPKVSTYAEARFKAWQSVNPLLSAEEINAAIKENNKSKQYRAKSRTSGRSRSKSPDIFRARSPDIFRARSPGRFRARSPGRNDLDAQLEKLAVDEYAKTRNISDPKSEQAKNERVTTYLKYYMNLQAASKELISITLELHKLTSITIPNSRGADKAQNLKHKAKLEADLNMQNYKQALYNEIISQLISANVYNYDRENNFIETDKSIFRQREKEIKKRKKIEFNIETPKKISRTNNISMR